MTVRTALCALGLACVMGAPGGAQEPAPPAALDSHGGFALQDPTGGKLLLMPNLTRPERLKTALCSDGSHFAVQFASRQAALKGGNGRVTPKNFEHYAGSVFTVVTGKVDPAATCFLVSDTLLAGATMLNVAPPQGSGVCAQPARFAALRNRPVVHCWPNARLGTTAHVALVEFERRGKDALAALVLVDGARTVFLDFPAEFKGAGEDLWRVDDGGVFSPDGITIVCALQRRGGYVLGTSWAGAEGLLLQIWTSEGSDRFVRILSDYWYRAPV